MSGWVRQSTITQFFDKVVSRYYKSLGNVEELLRLCDILHVYDNTEEPVRIIRKHKEELTTFASKY